MDQTTADVSIDTEVTDEVQALESAIYLSLQRRDALINNLSRSYLLMRRLNRFSLTVGGLCVVILLLLFIHNPSIRLF